MLMSNVVDEIRAHKDPAAAARFCKAVSDAGISSFSFFQSEKGGISWTTLMGTSKLRLLKNMNFETVFGQSEYGRARAKATRAIWDAFLALHAQFHSTTDMANGESRWTRAEFEAKAEQFFTLLTKAERAEFADGETPDPERGYPGEWVTPYCHILVVHWAELEEFHGVPLASFSCNGLEALNHAHQRMQFRTTNLGGGRKDLQGTHTPASQIMRAERRMWSYHGTNWWAVPVVSDQVRERREAVRRAEVQEEEAVVQAAQARAEAEAEEELNDLAAVGFVI